MIKNFYSFKDKTAVITGGAQGFGRLLGSTFAPTPDDAAPGSERSSTQGKSPWIA